MQLEIESIPDQEYRSRDNRYGLSFYEPLLRIPLQQAEDIIGVPYLSVVDHSVLEANPLLYENDLGEFITGTYRIDLSLLPEDSALIKMIETGEPIALIDLSVVSELRLDIPGVGEITPILLVTPNSVVVFALGPGIDSENLRYFIRNTSRSPLPYHNETRIGDMSYGETVRPVVLSFEDFVLRTQSRGTRIKSGFPPVLIEGETRTEEEEYLFIKNLLSRIIKEILELKQLNE